MAKLFSSLKIFIFVAVILNVLILGFIAYQSLYKNTTTETASNELTSDASDMPDMKEFYIFDIEKGRSSAFSIYELKSRFVWLYLWGEWCSICKEEMGSIKEFQSYISSIFPKEEFEFLYTHLADSLDVIKKKYFETELKENLVFPIYVPLDENQFSKDYEVRGVPSNFLFDLKEKKIIYSHIGKSTNESKEELLNILKEKIKISE